METILQTPPPTEREVYLEQLGAIHGLRDALGLDDRNYRELLERLTGSRSAKYMTPAQRERVIRFMRVHQALDESLQQLEAARDALNDVSAPQEGAMLKYVSLDGRREATMSASVEEIIATMRTLHGPEVRLVGAQERRLGSRTVLELAFERPAVLLMSA